MSIYRSVSSSSLRPVTHIAEDLYIPGNILFSSDNSLKTTDGTTDVIIAGSATAGYTNGIGVKATFNSIRKFLQINSTDIIIADDLNFCLRYFVRTSAKVSQFVAQCGKRGRASGEVKLAKFYRLQDIVLGKGRSVNKLFILDPPAVYYMDVNGYRIDVLVNLYGLEPVPYLTGLVLGPDTDGGSLLLLARLEIRNVSIANLNKITLPTQSTISFKARTNKSIDGNFSDAAYRYSDRIVSIAKGVYVIGYTTSYDDGRIRIIDFVTKFISSICTVSTALFQPGKITQCVMPDSYGLGVVKNALYIGGLNVIYQLPSK